MKKTIMIAVVFATLGGFTSVAFAERQPHMARAFNLLEQARNELSMATHDKGGHRVKAIEHIRIALEQVREGMEFDNRH